MKAMSILKHNQWQEQGFVVSAGYKYVGCNIYFGHNYLQTCDKCDPVYENQAKVS